MSCTGVRTVRLARVANRAQRNNEEGRTQPGEIQDLWDVARELRPHMRDLIALFSPLQFTALKCKLRTRSTRPRELPLKRWSPE